MLVYLTTRTLYMGDKLFNPKFDKDIKGIVGVDHVFLQVDLIL